MAGSTLNYYNPQKNAEERARLNAYKNKLATDYKLNIRNFDYAKEFLSPEFVAIANSASENILASYSQAKSASGGVTPEVRVASDIMMATLFGEDLSTVAKNHTAYMARLFGGREIDERSASQAFWDNFNTYSMQRKMSKDAKRYFNTEDEDEKAMLERRLHGWETALSAQQDYSKRNVLAANLINAAPVINQTARQLAYTAVGALAGMGVGALLGGVGSGVTAGLASNLMQTGVRASQILYGFNMFSDIWGLNLWEYSNLRKSDGSVLSKDEIYWASTIAAVGETALEYIQNPIGMGLGGVHTLISGAIAGSIGKIGTSYLFSSLGEAVEEGVQGFWNTFVQEIATEAYKGENGRLLKISKDAFVTLMNDTKDSLIPMLIAGGLGPVAQFTIGGAVKVGKAGFTELSEKLEREGESSPNMTAEEPSEDAKNRAREYQRTSDTSKFVPRELIATKRGKVKEDFSNVGTKDESGNKIKLDPVRVRYDKNGNFIPLASERDKAKWLINQGLDAIIVEVTNKPTSTEDSDINSEKVAEKDFTGYVFEDEEDWRSHLTDLEEAGIEVEISEDGLSVEYTNDSGEQVVDNFSKDTAEAIRGNREQAEQTTTEEPITEESIDKGDIPGRTATVVLDGKKETVNLDTNKVVEQETVVEEKQEEKSDIGKILSEIQEGVSKEDRKKVSDLAKKIKSASNGNISGKTAWGLSHFYYSIPEGKRRSIENRLGENSLVLNTDEYIERIKERLNEEELSEEEYDRRLSEQLDKHSEDLGWSLLDSAQMVLTEDSDVSTFIHEMVHILNAVIDGAFNDVISTIKKEIGREKGRGQVRRFLEENESIIGLKAEEALEVLSNLKANRLLSEKEEEVLASMIEADFSYPRSSKASALLPDSIRNLFRKLAELIATVYNRLAGYEQDSLSYLPSKIRDAFTEYFFLNNYEPTELRVESVQEAEEVLSSEEIFGEGFEEIQAQEESEEAITEETKEESIEESEEATTEEVEQENFEEETEEVSKASEEEIIQEAEEQTEEEALQETGEEAEQDAEEVQTDEEETIDFEEYLYSKEKPLVLWTNEALVEEFNDILFKGFLPPAGYIINFDKQDKESFIVKTGEEKGVALYSVDKDKVFAFAEKLTDRQKERAYKLQDEALRISEATGDFTEYYEDNVVPNFSRITSLKQKKASDLLNTYVGYAKGALYSEPTMEKAEAKIKTLFREFKTAINETIGIVEEERSQKKRGNSLSGKGKGDNIKNDVQAVQSIYPNSSVRESETREGAGGDLRGLSGSEPINISNNASNFRRRIFGMGSEEGTGSSSPTWTLKGGDAWRNFWRGVRSVLSGDFPGGHRVYERTAGASGGSRSEFRELRELSNDSSQDRERFLKALNRTRNQDEKNGYAVDNKTDEYLQDKNVRFFISDDDTTGFLIHYGEDGVNNLEAVFSSNVLDEQGNIKARKPKEAMASILSYAIAEGANALDAYGPEVFIVEEKRPNQKVIREQQNFLPMEYGFYIERVVPFDEKAMFAVYEGDKFVSIDEKAKEDWERSGKGRLSVYVMRYQDETIEDTINAYGTRITPEYKARNVRNSIIERDYNKALAIRDEEIRIFRGDFDVANISTKDIEATGIPTRVFNRMPLGYHNIDSIISKKAISENPKFPSALAKAAVNFGKESELKQTASFPFRISPENLEKLNTGDPVDKDVIELSKDIIKRSADYMSNNLVYIVKQFNQRFPGKIDELTRWYYQAHAFAREFAEKFNDGKESLDTTLKKTSAVFAVLSPNYEWGSNVALAGLVLDLYYRKLEDGGYFTDRQKRIFNAWNTENEEILKKKEKERETLINKLKKIKTEEKAEAVSKEISKLEEEIKSVKNTIQKNQDTIGSTFDKLLESKDYNRAKEFIVTLVKVNSEIESTYKPNLIPGSGYSGNSDTTFALNLAAGNNIVKALTILDTKEDKIDSVISKYISSKGKVRNFYNNILNPSSLFGDITSDTWAVRDANPGLIDPKLSAALVASVLGGAPSSKGLGFYTILSEAYRTAVDRLYKEDGLLMLPQELQSLVWVMMKDGYTYLSTDLLSSKDPEMSERIKKRNEAIRLWNVKKNKELLEFITPIYLDKYNETLSEQPDLVSRGPLALYRFRDDSPIKFKDGGGPIELRNYTFYEEQASEKGKEAAAIYQELGGNLGLAERIREASERLNETEERSQKRRRNEIGFNKFTAIRESNLHKTEKELASSFERGEYIPDGVLEKYKQILSRNRKKDTDREVLLSRINKELNKRDYYLRMFDEWGESALRLKRDEFADIVLNEIGDEEGRRELLEGFWDYIHVPTPKEILLTFKNRVNTFEKLQKFAYKFNNLSIEDENGKKKKVIVGGNIAKSLYRIARYPSYSDTEFINEVRAQIDANPAGWAEMYVRTLTDDEVKKIFGADRSYVLTHIALKDAEYNSLREKTINAGLVESSLLVLNEDELRSLADPEIGRMTIAEVEQNDFINEQVAGISDALYRGNGTEIKNLVKKLEKRARLLATNLENAKRREAETRARLNEKLKERENLNKEEKTALKKELSALRQDKNRIERLLLSTTKKLNALKAKVIDKKLTDKMKKALRWDSSRDSARVEPIIHWMFAFMHGFRNQDWLKQAYKGKNAEEYIVNLEDEDYNFQYYDFDRDPIEGLSSRMPGDVNVNIHSIATLPDILKQYIAIEDEENEVLAEILAQAGNVKQGWRYLTLDAKKVILDAILLAKADGREEIKEKNDNKRARRTREANEGMKASLSYTEDEELTEEDINLYLKRHHLEADALEPSEDGTPAVTPDMILEEKRKLFGAYVEKATGREDNLIGRLRNDLMFLSQFTRKLDGGKEDGYFFKTFYEKSRVAYDAKLAEVIKRSDEALETFHRIAGGDEKSKEWKEIEKWYNSKYEITSTKGNVREVSGFELESIYIYLEQVEAFRHLVDSHMNDISLESLAVINPEYVRKWIDLEMYERTRLALEGKKGNTTLHILEDEELEEIRQVAQDSQSILPEKIRAIADAKIDLLLKYEERNAEAYRRIDNRTLNRIERYFPLRSIDGDNGIKIDVKERPWIDKGMYQDRKMKTDYKLNLSNSFTTFAKAINDQETYNNMAELIKDFNWLLSKNQGNLAEVIENRYGKDAKDTLRNWLSRFAGNNRSTAMEDIEKGLNLLLSNLTLSAISANLLSVIKNFSSSIHAMTQGSLTPVEFFGTLLNLVSHREEWDSAVALMERVNPSSLKGSINTATERLHKIKELSPVATAGKGVVGKVLKADERLAETLLKPFEVVENLMRMTAFMATYNKYGRTQEAINKASLLVHETQTLNDPFSSSPFRDSMVSHPLGRFYLVFSTDLVHAWDMLFGATINDLKAGEYKKAAMKLAGFMLTAGFLTLVGGGWLPKEEGEAFDIEGFLSKYLITLATFGVPFWGNVIEGMLSGYDSSLVKAQDYWFDLAKDIVKEDRDGEQIAKDLMEALLETGGSVMVLPTTAINKTVKAIENGPSGWGYLLNSNWGKYSTRYSREY